VSGFAASVYAYVGEFNTDKNRGTIISWLSCGVGFAAIIQPLLAWWILSYEWSFELYDGYFFRPWRLLMLVYISPGVIGILWLLFRLPESPKYYLAHNEKEKALEVMRWMYRVNKGAKSLENFTVDELVMERSAEVTAKNHKGV
jgi:Sugar (and other) transporter